MHEQDLQVIADALRGLAQRFQESTSAAAPHLNSADRATFNRLLLESRAILDTDLGPANVFSTRILMLTRLPGFGVTDAPLPEDLDEAIEVVEGGLNQLRRQPRRAAPTVVGIPAKRPYVDPSRIAELQALMGAKWDPRRLVRMLQEINAAHEHDLHMATAMLVRAVTDHVPPIFGKENFASVAAQHTAGSKDGRSFKGSMKHLYESMKSEADGMLHMPIRRTEVLPTATQVDYSQSFDALLGEVIRLLRE